MQNTDVAIIGGGIVGLATAFQLSERFPKLHGVVLDKEASVGAHQTGHNSGVLHSGIYYRPGSLKALNCRSGKEAMERFCERERVRRSCVLRTFACFSKVILFFWSVRKTVLGP